jgi:hypothetical protein
MALQASSSPRKFAGLEALLAEDRSPLGGSERHRGFPAAVRAVGDRFYSLAGNHRPRRAADPLGFAGLTPFGFVLEVLVSEELLFSRRPDELLAAVHAPEDPVLELHRSPPRPRSALLQFASELLPIPLACERLLCPALVSRLQVEGVFLDVLDDVFLLHLPLEASEGAFNRFALLNLHFSHKQSHPFRVATSLR